MSNGRPFRRQLTDLFGPLDGDQIPGGCPACDAYQTVEPLAAGAWQVTVHHDHGCPSFVAMQEAAP